MSKIYDQNLIEDDEHLSTIYARINAEEGKRFPPRIHCLGSMEDERDYDEDERADLGELDLEEMFEYLMKKGEVK